MAQTLAVAPSKDLHSTVSSVSPKLLAPAARRVLIVEDNKLAREQLEQLLRRDPHLDVYGTEDGHEALRELTTHDYSLVLTDLRMPNLDGMDLLKEVQRRGLPVTVIVMTGYASIAEEVARQRRPLRPPLWPVAPQYQLANLRVQAQQVAVQRPVRAVRGSSSSRGRVIRQPPSLARQAS